MLLSIKNPVQPSPFLEHMSSSTLAYHTHYPQSPFSNNKRPRSQSYYREYNYKRPEFGKQALPSSMDVQQSGILYGDSRESQPRGFTSNDHRLEVIQQAQFGKVAIGSKEKDRKPIDPPPVVQLTIPGDTHENFLFSTHYFMVVTLAETQGGPPRTPRTIGQALAGTHTSSLHRLKDTNNQDGAFFIFGDLSVKVEGSWILQFNLYMMNSKDFTCNFVTSTQSQPFIVSSHKDWTGLRRSTELIQSFADQGVRLRLRKNLKTAPPKARTHQAPTFETPNYGKKEQIVKHDGEIGRLRGDDSQHSPAGNSSSMSSHQQHLPQLSNTSLSLQSNYGGMNEPSNKRPRTGSEQHTSPYLQHHQPISQLNQQVPQRAYPSPSPQGGYSVYNSPSALHRAFSFSNIQSPQASESSRSGDFYAPQQSDLGANRYSSQRRRSTHQQLPAPVQGNQFQHTFPYHGPPVVTPTTAIHGGMTSLQMNSPSSPPPGSSLNPMYRQQPSHVDAGSYGHHQSSVYEGKLSEIDAELYRGPQSHLDPQSAYQEYPQYTTGIESGTIPSTSLNQAQGGSDLQESDVRRHYGNL